MNKEQKIKDLESRLPGLIEDLKITSEGSEEYSRMNNHLRELFKEYRGLTGRPYRINVEDD